MSATTESRSLQLIVTDESLLQAVSFNYEELKDALAERLDQYNSLVVTEEAINAAKQDRAGLNKLESALKGKQQEIERRLLGDFSLKLRELRSMVVSASKSIDDQVKYFERQVRDQKKDDIRAIYDDHIGDLAGMLPFERLFDTAWVNKTSGMLKIEKELTGKIETVRKDLEVIDQLRVAENIAVAVKDYYLRTMDLSGALSEKTRLEKAAAILLERQKRQEEEQRVEIDAKQPRQIVREVVQEPPKVASEPQVPPVRQIDFRVWVTREQKDKLVVFLDENGIQYGKVAN